MTTTLAEARLGIQDEAGQFEVDTGTFNPSNVKKKLNRAISTTPYLFQTIRDSTTLDTIADTYTYSLPATIEGDAHQIYIEVNTEDADYPYAPLMNWNYDPANHEIEFPYYLPSERELRLIGKGRLSTVADESDEIEADEPDIRHLYALTLQYLFQERFAQVMGSEKKEYEQDVEYWSRISMERGQIIVLPVPPKIIKIPNWTFYGKTIG